MCAINIDKCLQLYARVIIYKSIILLNLIDSPIKVATGLIIDALINALTLTFNVTDVPREMPERTWTHTRVFERKTRFSYRRSLLTDVGGSRF